MPLKAEGEFAQVKQFLDEGLSRITEINPDMVFYSLLVDTAVLEEDAKNLKEYTPRLLDQANQNGHKLFKAVALRSLAVADRLDGKYKPAQNQLEEAEAIFQDMETNWQLGRTYYEFGQLMVAQDNPAEAKKQFEKAVHCFESIGALPDAERTQFAIESLSS